MQKPKLKQIINITIVLMAVLIVSLIGIQIIPHLKNTKTTIGQIPATVYNGGINSGIVLLSNDNYHRASIMRALKGTATTAVLISPDEEDIQGIAQVIEDASLFLEKLGISRNNVSVIAVEGYSTGALLSNLNNPIQTKYAFIDPSYDYDELIDMGIYSCSIMTHSKLVAGHSGVREKETSYVTFYNLLSGDTIIANGRPVAASRNTTTLKLSPMSTTNNALLSPELLTHVVSWTTGVNNGVLISRYATAEIVFGISLLLVALAFFVLMSLNVRNAYPFATGMVSAEVKTPSLFYLSRVFLWVLTLLSGGIIAIGFWIINLPLDIGGRLFLAYVLGCMASTWWFYKMGMLGIKGIPQDIKGISMPENKRKAIALFALLFMCGVALAISGMWIMEFSTGKLTLFSCVFVFSFFGFIWIMKDLLILEEIISKDYVVILMLLLPYVPLILLSLIYIPIGNLTATLAALKQIIWLFTVICYSQIIRSLTGSVTLSAITSAFLLSFFTCFLQVI